MGEEGEVEEEAASMTIVKTFLEREKGKREHKGVLEVDNSTGPWKWGIFII